MLHNAKKTSRTHADLGRLFRLPVRPTGRRRPRRAWARALYPLDAIFMPASPASAEIADLTHCGNILTRCAVTNARRVARRAPGTRGARVRNRTLPGSFGDRYAVKITRRFHSRLLQLNFSRSQARCRFAMALPAYVWLARPASGRVFTAGRSTSGKPTRSSGRPMACWTRRRDSGSRPATARSAPASKPIPFRMGALRTVGRPPAWPGEDVGYKVPPRGHFVSRIMGVPGVTSAR